MLWQRQLNEDAVDVGIGGELRNLADQFFLRRFLRQADFNAAHAGFDGLLGFAGDVDVAGRIVADEHNGERRLRGKLLHRFGHTGADVRGDGLAVNAASGHGFSSYRAMKAAMSLSLAVSISNTLSRAV